MMSEFPEEHPLDNTIIILSFLERKLSQIGNIKQDILHFQTLKTNIDQFYFRIRTRLQIFSGEIELFGGDIRDEIKGIIAILNDISNADTATIDKYFANIYAKIFSLAKMTNLDEKVKFMREIFLNEINFSNIDNMSSSFLPLQTDPYIPFSRSNYNIDFLIIILKSGLPVYTYRFREIEFLEEKYQEVAIINIIENFYPELVQGATLFEIKNKPDNVAIRAANDRFSVLLFAQEYSFELKIKVDSFLEFLELLSEDFPPNKLFKDDNLAELINHLDTKIKLLFSK